MRPLKLALGLATAFLMACEGTGAPFAPDQSIEIAPLFGSTGTAECVTISFDDQGFSHGDAVTSLASGFGFDLTVTAIDGGLNTARIYDTQNQGGPDFDLEVPPAPGRCSDCTDPNLNNVLILEDPAGFADEGDGDIGGTIQFTGFSGNGLFYVESYKALDQERVEAPIVLSVDGTEVGRSTEDGDGSVETVATDITTFEDVAEFDFGGSGAIDDLVICRTSEGVGRMTGGGTVRLQDGVRFTHGFTLHCDNTLSNNLEINWGGMQWHIEKETLENVSCTEDPDVGQEPPPAPFDTFEATATGRLNGVWGSPIWFKLQDAGEPGGKNDQAGLKIWAVGADPSVDTPVVDVPFAPTEGGNIQAHYDQPHGCNVNKC